jgi:hypothetical protein
MAISVDTIYQRVLALANKEQRGYITPQEYNLLANHAQMAIFESYFYDKNQRNRIEDARSIEVDETDISELLDRKLAPFQSYEALTDSGTTFPPTTDVGSHVVYQTGTVFLGDEPCQKVSMFEAQRFKKSKRHMAVTDDQAPFYTDNRETGKDIVVYAGGVAGAEDQAETANITVECFRVPKTVAWGYVVVNGKALYNSTSTVSQDFELHRSEEDTLTNKILELAGIVMNKTGLTTTIGQYSAAETTSQKS